MKTNLVLCICLVMTMFASCSSQEDSKVGYSYDLKIKAGTTLGEEKIKNITCEEKRYDANTFEAKWSEFTISSKEIFAQPLGVNKTGSSSPYVLVTGASIPSNRPSIVNYDLKCKALFGDYEFHKITTQWDTSETRRNYCVSVTIDGKSIEVLNGKNEEDKISVIVLPTDL